MRDLPPGGDRWIDRPVSASIHLPLSADGGRTGRMPRGNLSGVGVGRSRMDLASLSTSTRSASRSPTPAERCLNREEIGPAPPGPRFRAAARGSRRSDRVGGGGPPPALVRGGWPKKCVHLGVSQDGEGQVEGVEFFLSTLYFSRYSFTHYIITWSILPNRIPTSLNNINLHHTYKHPWT